MTLEEIRKLCEAASPAARTLMPLLLELAEAVRDYGIVVSCRCAEIPCSCGYVRLKLTHSSAPTGRESQACVRMPSRSRR